ncbi:MAG: hypothetical protein EOP34_10365 [Rickettsiales bacterium]|nr:MAG: hypothetical protein EOP34_10365 [Rickettsiales bacterium]
MNIEDFNFKLPKELIAKYPSAIRGNSKLMHLKNDKIYHKNFSDITDLINQDDVIVFNDTKVINALISGYKIENSEKKYFSFNLLKEIDNNIWQAIVSKDTWYNDDVFAKNLSIGNIIYYYNDLSAIIKEINKEECYIILEFNRDKEELLLAIQDNGKIPLPPYIDRETEESDNIRYQTVFAKNYGAVAAPTAGLQPCTS